MKNIEKVNQLKDFIHKSLSCLIDSNYILLDLPYHKNIGDTLIYQGELDFLENLPFQCLGKGSYIMNYLPEISDDTIVLIQGGGNFGDLYRDCQEYKNRVVKKYKKNKIIFFPQTVFYNDYSLLKEDAKTFNEHKNIFFCVRDLVSKKLVEEYFFNTSVLLVPDMAFCIDFRKFSPKKSDKNKRGLFFKRVDHELNDAYDYAMYLNKDYIYEQHDWPTFETESFRMFALRVLLGVIRRLKNDSFLKRLLNNFTNYYYHNMVKNYLIDKGIKFIDQYNHVVTTRLHGCILSILRDKDVILLDNSYGKNSEFYKCWLNDLVSLKLEEKNGKGKK